MEPLRNNEHIPRRFIRAGLLLLAAGMLFGLMGGVQYLVPGLFREWLSFERVRPLHVSSVVFWIIFAATGGVLTYLQQYTGKALYSARMAMIQLALFGVAVVAIIVSYFAGYFGGREYWEFPPVLALPFLAGWVLFLINFFRTLPSLRQQPVYVWMWTTGIIAFLFSFLESYLWLFPYFRENVVNDMTLQWKSYGSLVGAWNMLVYGGSLFLMEKISGKATYSRSQLAYWMYFLSLFNLMFNWGHHIYTLPTHAWVKHISYTVSMTELLIFGRIIYNWRSTLSTARKYAHRWPYRLLSAADAWVFLTLILAIAMSVPGINVYTHGTHITVAHTMGATIGINSFLLLAISFDALGHRATAGKWLHRGFWTANISLLLFWISLIAAGVIRARWQMSDTTMPFSQMMLQMRPFLAAFVVAGAALMAGMLMMIHPMLCKSRHHSSSATSTTLHHPFPKTTIPDDNETSVPGYRQGI